MGNANASVHQRNRLFFLVLVLSVMVLFGQACNVTKLAAVDKVGTSEVQKNAAIENGNGTSYDGKLVFLELQSGYTCEGKSAPKSILIRENDKWKLISNSKQRCAESSTSVSDVSYNQNSHYLSLGTRGVTYGISLLNATNSREFTVDPKADPNSPNINPGHGICANSVGLCSLRAAFDELNSVDLPAIINIPSGTYAITNLLKVKILSPVLLQGSSSATTTLMGAGDPLLSQGILGIFPDYSAAIVSKFWSPTTIISGIGFTNASNPAVEVSGGSAINLMNGSALISQCRFIDNHSSYIVSASTSSNELIVEDSIFTSNERSVALATSTTGSIKIARSEFSNNELAISVSTTVNFLLEQSSVYNNQHGVLVSGCRGKCAIENSTLANNELGVRVMSFALGSDSDVTIRNSTIAGNATGLEYIKFDFGRWIGAGFLYLQNSILSNLESSGPNKTNCLFESKGTVVGSTAALDHFISQNSIVDDASCGTNGIIVANPMLQPLTLNGGPTPTMMPMPNSPAIDSGSNLFCPVVDQRGSARPVDSIGLGAICDIGAVEVP